MRKRIMKHVSLLVILSICLTFISASGIMYGKFSSHMKQGVRDEAQFLLAGIEEIGESYIYQMKRDVTASRITFLDKDGTVLTDTEADPGQMQNHKDRPEFVQAQEHGYGESIRFSETLLKQTFYSAFRLENGKILRVAKTTDSMFFTLISALVVLGTLMLVILLLEFFLVQKQTKCLIEPINTLDLEHPLENVCYEELRPLLVRVDEQNRQISRQVDELKKAELLRKEFSANVSHELKTPLMSISGYAELMMNGMVPPENVPDFSGRIYHEAKRLTSLVMDIIQISRLDEKNSDLPFETVDLYELAEDVVFHLRDVADKKQISLEFSGSRVVLEGVRQILYEMFYNLVDNALRYTEEGGRVCVFAGEKNGKVCFSVEDNGIGIPKEEQKRIFERFYRVDKSHSRETGGTGLGLSIVKHGAILHHAEIYVESESGKGTKMELRF